MNIDETVVEGIILGISKSMDIIEDSAVLTNIGTILHTLIKK